MAIDRHPSRGFKSRETRFELIARGQSERRTNIRAVGFESRSRFRPASRLALGCQCGGKLPSGRSIGHLRAIRLSRLSPHRQPLKDRCIALSAAQTVPSSVGDDRRGFLSHEVHASALSERATFDDCFLTVIHRGVIRSLNPKQSVERPRSEGAHDVCGSTAERR